jgi:hypothetical protein
MRLRRLISLFIVTCLTAALSLPVIAAPVKSVNEKAISLYKLNILRGNGIDFNLRGQLVRGEAAAFIVRLMGKEEEVLAESEKWSETVFNDVKTTDWFAPYVGYCKQLGIIDGYPNGYYGPTDNISEKAFLKLLLGLLGYRYGKDFDWSNVYIKAHEERIVTGEMYYMYNDDNMQYKRSDVINAIYNTLSRKSKETGITIIENLIDNNVIDRETAINEGLIVDTVKTEIMQITALDANTLYIKFNESVKPIDISNIKIFETQNNSNLLTVSVKSQTNTDITLTTSSQIPDKGYTIVIDDLVDQENNTQDLTGNFSGYKSIEVISDFFRISKIESVSKNVINVYFTQPINLNAEIPVYYEILRDNATYIKGSFQTISAKILAPYDNAVSLFLKDNDLYEGEQYTLKISGSLVGKYGVGLNSDSGDSMSFTGNGSANEEFYITGVEPMNQRYIKVHFNKDVDISSVQTISNYSLESNGVSKGSVVGVLVTSEGVYKNKEAILRVAPALEDGKNYELRIKDNIYDSFRQMQLDKDSTYPFIGTSENIDDLEIISVHAEDKGTLLVYFNKPLYSDATITSYYSVTGVSNPAYYRIPGKVYYNSNDNPYAVKLFISDNSLEGSATYKLQVSKSLRDYLGEMSNNDATYSFSGSGSENMAPFIVEAKTVSKDSILVTFNEEILPASPNTLVSNYLLEYKDGDGDTVTIKPTSLNQVNDSVIC